MFCSHCGKEISEEAAFCPYCGSPQLLESNPAYAQDTQRAPDETPRKSNRAVRLISVSLLVAAILVAIVGAVIFIGDRLDDSGQLTAQVTVKPQLSEVNRAAAKAAVEAVDRYNSESLYVVTTAEKAVRHAIDSMEPAQDEASEEITSQLEYYMDKLDIELSRFSWLDNELDTEAVMQYRNLIAELAELE